jgi:competence ComEA-like helix-hairpin-helix protein
MGPVDINQADVEHWQLLPGIGEKRAQMIVNYREKLGGFLSLEQVAETRGLPDSTYQQIRSMLVLDVTTTHQINLNTATTEQLDAHPYISFKQASLIVADRSQNGKYHKVEDLLRIPAFVDKVWLERVKPYLSAQ